MGVLNLKTKVFPQKSVSFKLRTIVLENSTVLKNNIKSTLAVFSFLYLLLY